jgi:HAMP domain-containing protein/anti-sigma regulatory factor (Ser/Thr protein kinase)
LKLVAALVLPMLVVAGYLGVSVRSATEQRTVASQQQAEVAKFVSVASFSDAIGVENLVIIDRDATDADLAAARAETDAIVNLLRSPDLELRAETLEAVETRYAELLELRATIGDRPFEIRLNAQSELRSGDLTMTGNVIPALTALSALPSAVLADFDFDSSTSASATSELLDDYFLVQRYRADLGRELATLIRVSSLPGNLVDSSIIELVGTSIGATDQSRQLMTDLGSESLTEASEPVLNGASIEQYESLRSIVDAAEIGTKPEIDPAQLQVAASRLDVALAGVANNAIGELDARSADSVFRANRDLVVSALIGFWLLVFVGLVLRVLYRAIKSPIERLTEQAQQISLIELPEVVAQMRRGEIEQIPEVEEIKAESNDEIGELVHAFNGMHRTAVELAAEQANSRRVVADMFVNLGRRNQRLVNRLLKGLTVLEQHEQDPDKLASLYEIDHVATRMRRNAESLLVLAGAGQSRRWDRPVPMYDIARASLAEVENYERVQIDVTDGIDVDGSIVADLTHLLAELVENALSFSPPTSPVEIVARDTFDGVLIAVSDHGVGMPVERLEEANRQITLAAGEDETPSEFLGHYVVGRLAARHAISVELVEGAAGGITARVLLPRVGAGSLSAAPTAAPDPIAALSVTPESGSDSLVSARTSDAPEVDSLEALVASLDATATALPPVAPTPRPVPAEHSPVATTLSEQAPRRQPTVPADAPPAIPADPAPAVASAPAPVAPVSAPPAPSEPNPASFDWPSPLDVDPLSKESRAVAAAAVAPAPPMPQQAPAAPMSPLSGTAPTDSVVPSPPPTPLQPSNDATSDLNRAADSAVADALSVFGTQRRKPGAQLPVTDLFASISGSMALGSDSGAQSPASPSRPTPSRPTSSVTDLGDEEQVRFDLSGFQQGTTRADREIGDINS